MTRIFSTVVAALALALLPSCVRNDPPTPKAQAPVPQMVGPAAPLNSNPSLAGTAKTRLTPEQSSLVLQALGMQSSPGQTVDIESIHSESIDQGSEYTKRTAEGLGAGASAQGQTLNEKITGSPPDTNIDPEGSNARGGGIDQSLSAIGGGMDIQRTFLFLAIACGIGAIFCVSRLWISTATYLGIASGAFFFAFMYPSLAGILLGGAGVLTIGPWLWERWKTEKVATLHRDSTRTLLAAIDDAPTEIRVAINHFIQSHVTPQEWDNIQKLRKADDLRTREDLFDPHALVRSLQQGATLTTRGAFTTPASGPSEPASPVPAPPPVVG